LREAPSDNLRAAFMVLVACAAFGGMGALAKAVNADGMGPAIHPLQIMACRFLFGFLTVVPIAAATRQLRFRTSILHWHAARVVCGVSGVAGIFIAVQYLPVADVTAISFSSPLFTLVFAVLALKEAVNGRRWLAAGIGFAGVLVIVQPGTSAFAPASLIALATALIIGAEMAIIRRMARQDPPMMIVLSSNTLGSLAGLGLAAAVWVWPSPAQWPFLIAVGSFTMLGQLLFARASALGEASLVAPLTYASILFATIYGVLFFDEVPGWPFYLGASVLVGAGVYLNLQGNRRPATGSGDA
jgi:drug/metabolite transporter (DMT)-like permease